MTSSQATYDVQRLYAALQRHSGWAVANNLLRETALSREHLARARDVLIAIGAILKTSKAGSHINLKIIRPLDQVKLDQEIERRYGFQGYNHTVSDDLHEARLQHEALGEAERAARMWRDLLGSERYNNRKSQSAFAK